MIDCKDVAAQTEKYMNELLGNALKTQSDLVVYLEVQSGLKSLIYDGCPKVIYRPLVEKVLSNNARFKPADVTEILTAASLVSGDNLFLDNAIAFTRNNKYITKITQKLPEIYTRETFGANESKIDGLTSSHLQNSADYFLSLFNTEYIMDKNNPRSKTPENPHSSNISSIDIPFRFASETVHGIYLAIRKLAEMNPANISQYENALADAADRVYSKPV